MPISHLLPLSLEPSSSHSIWTFHDPHSQPTLRMDLAYRNCSEIFTEPNECTKGLSEHLGLRTICIFRPGHRRATGQRHPWVRLSTLYTVPGPLIKSERGCSASTTITAPNGGPKYFSPSSPSPLTTLQPKHETEKQMQNWFLP